METYKKPMTQASFLRVEGLGGWDLDNALETLEESVDDGVLPPWFGQIPRGESMDD